MTMEKSGQLKIFDTAGNKEVTLSSERRTGKRTRTEKAAAGEEREAQEQNL